jgi:hypothetical protein
MFFHAANCKYFVCSHKHSGRNACLVLFICYITFFPVTVWSCLVRRLNHIWIQIWSILFIFCAISLVSMIAVVLFKISNLLEQTCSRNYLFFIWFSFVPWMTLLFRQHIRYLNKTLICLNRSKYDHRSSDEWRSYFHNELDIWIEFCLDLFMSSVISHNSNCCRVFSLNDQSNWTETWFELFSFQMNFTYVIMTNLCFHISEKEECSLDLYYSLVIWFMCYK